MIELDIRSLSRSQQRRIQRDKAFGEFAEEVVSQEYGLNRFVDSDWYDATDESSGARYEVKSTSSTVGEKYPGKGRFRLWEEQHRSLTAAEGANMAWYAFVLLDERDGTLKIQRRRPSTITQLVNERGGWNQSGHTGMESRQMKLPYSVVL